VVFELQENEGKCGLGKLRNVRRRRRRRWKKKKKRRV